MINLDEFSAFPVLLRGRLPLHVEDFVLGPEVGRGIAVAVQAPPHRQWLALRGQGHFVYATVTRTAAYALGDVNAVVEIDIAWKAVDPVPADRLMLRQAFPHWRQQCRVRPDLRMARHADVRRGEPGKGRFLDAGMAIKAAYSEFADVVLVAERDGCSRMTSCPVT